MTTKAKVALWGLGALVLIVCIVEIVRERELRIRAEAVQQAQQQVIEKAKQDFASAKADQDRNNATLKDQLAAIAAQRTVVVTPQQAVERIPEIIPNLPAPVTVQPAPTPENPKAQAVVIPEEDLQAFKNYKLTCDETGAKLQACSLNFADEQIKTDSLNTQLKATEKERDQWKVAAKGGTFWHRVGIAGKYIVIGGAVGYLAGKKF